MITLTEPEAAELARWHHGKMSIPEWLDSGPAPERLQASLVRALDRPGRGGVFARVLADRLGAEVDQVFAEHYPRKAAKLARECRERGDHPHAEKLHAALVALMFCANCGPPLADPVSIDRGIGPDCWPRIDPAWRASIERRTAFAQHMDCRTPGGTPMTAGTWPVRQDQAMVHAPYGEQHGAQYKPRRTLPPELGAMLAAARRRRGWGVREAARCIGVSPGTIVHLERARRAPSLIVAEDIIEAYRLPAADADWLRSAAVTDAGRSSPLRAGY